MYIFKKLGSTKSSESIKTIQSKDELKRVGEYCIQDCVLVAEIMDYKKVYSCILSRAELFLCDPRDLLLKGQQQIVFN